MIDIIDFFANLYPFVMWGIAMCFLVLALVMWYCIYVDMKDKEKFDQKYRQSRNIKNKEWDI